MAKLVRNTTGSNANAKWEDIKTTCKTLADMGATLKEASKTKDTRWLSLVTDKGERLSTSKVLAKDSVIPTDGKPDTALIATLNDKQSRTRGAKTKTQTTSGNSNPSIRSLKSSKFWASFDLSSADVDEIKEALDGIKAEKQKQEKINLAKAKIAKINTAISAVKDAGCDTPAELTTALKKAQDDLAKLEQK